MASPIDGGTIVITGASSGIGREMARQLAPRAARLILVARRVDRLEALRDELLEGRPTLEVVVRPADLSSRDAIVALAEALLAEHEAVDVLINNAGFGHHGRLEDASPEKLERMLMVNVVAPTLLTRLLLPPMIARRRGGVLNISSGHGLVTMPGFAVYCGTKHYLTAFTDALAGEVADAGLHLTQVCPGPVSTEFNERAGVDANLGRLSGLVSIDGAECARQTLAAFDRNKPFVIPGITMRAVLAIGQQLPRWLYRTVGGWITVGRRPR